MIIILIIGILLLFDGCFNLIKGKSPFIKTSASIQKPILYARIMGGTDLLLGIIYIIYYFHELSSFFMIISQIVLLYSAVILIRVFKIRE